VAGSSPSAPKASLRSCNRTPRQAGAGADPRGRLAPFAGGARSRPTQAYSKRAIYPASHGCRCAMATRSQAGAGGPHRHFADHPRPLASLVALVFRRADWVWGHQCQRARYPSWRGMSAAARAATRRATAPARRCNVGRAARRGTFEHWVAARAPKVASRL
jgi:hypothetical protein